MTATPMSSAATPTGAGPIDRHKRLAGCLERARAGDQRALDDIVHELNPLLWHVARAQNLGADDAADVVQTTWLELLRQLHQIRSPQALTAWLTSATRREAWRVNARRRHTTGVTMGTEILATIADTSPEPAERLDLDERNRVLWQHYQSLPDRCQALLRVVAMVDRPDYDVVATALSMPRGSIGPTRGRCLSKLRELLLADPAWSAR
jgi:RNA polymerase sigma factor (sigma-70 family)